MCPGRSCWNHNTYARLEEGDAPEVLLSSPQFQKFALAQIDKWLDIAVDWLLLGSRILVVHYEMMLVDPMKELDR